LSRNSSHSEEKADKFFLKTHSLYDLFSSCTQQQSGNSTSDLGTGKITAEVACLIHEENSCYQKGTDLDA
jgi:hypothetical protein